MLFGEIRISASSRMGGNLFGHWLSLKTYCTYLGIFDKLTWHGNVLKIVVSFLLRHLVTV